ncbi:DUF6087 family protein [Streptomyces sp. NPDC026659]|uniref:DUF6087 family protein n=1 Tax=Streptomyces sp. NPDC026659 TaxID=3155123 RepID=UPI0033F279AA
MADDHEPLEQWAERRAARRPRQGERRPISLGDEPQHGVHVHPDAPRGIEEWDGQDWVPSGTATNLAAAAAATGEDAVVRARRVPLPEFGRLPKMPDPYRPTIPFHRLIKPSAD